MLFIIAPLADSFPAPNRTLGLHMTLLAWLHLLLCVLEAALAASPYPYARRQSLNVTQRSDATASDSNSIAPSKKFEGSSSLIHFRYHMGPVLSAAINTHIIWYGGWASQNQTMIRDFLHSISDENVSSPSLAQWWSTVALYTDQTGANVTRSILISREYNDRSYSQGGNLTRLSIQNIIAHAVSGSDVDHRSSIFLVLTSPDVIVQDFCRAACGFHYFTFPSVVGFTLPYAWVGHSGKQCADFCAYPFAVPTYMAGSQQPLQPPNADVSLDGMVSVIAHELAEMASNPLVNAWYAGEDPTFPTEIGDLCEGIYGTGGGGGYIGQVNSDAHGSKFNVNGSAGRKFLVQWVWNPELQACSGPNAIR